MNVRKILWLVAGFLLLGVAYLGVILPGLPFSTPAVGAAYCFAKSSNRMHNWLYSHPLFGPFLTNFKEKKIFPTRAKYAMVTMMSISLSVIWFTSYNINMTVGIGVVMAIVAAWGWSYPGSEEEWIRRQKNGKV